MNDILVGILKEILEELRFQTKLMKDLFENKDAHRFNMRKNRQGIQAGMNLIQQQLNANPAFKANPELQKVISNLFKLMPQ